MRVGSGVGGRGTCVTPTGTGVAVGGSVTTGGSVGTTVRGTKTVGGGDAGGLVPGVGSTGVLVRGILVGTTSVSSDGGSSTGGVTRDVGVVEIGLLLVPGVATRPGTGDGLRTKGVREGIGVDVETSATRSGRAVGI